MPADSLEYDVVDVFADQPFAGNQLAVVHGAEGLSTSQLLAIAREFNYSETTFPTPVSEGRYAVRIFTPSGEIPFAGHPTLGTAWVLRAKGSIAGDAIQECGAGEIQVRFLGDDVQLAAVARDLAGPVSPAAVEALLADVGLSTGDQVGEAYVAGTGLNFVHVRVTDEAVVRAHASFRPLGSLGVDVGDPIAGINLYAANGPAIHSRVFCPGVDVAEDPATGSAAAGLGLALVASGHLPDGGRFEISQGLEMGRPSRLSCLVDVVDSVGVVARVGGRVQPIASGRIAVPPA